MDMNLICYELNGFQKICKHNKIKRYTSTIKRMCSYEDAVMKEIWSWLSALTGLQRLGPMSPTGEQTCWGSVIVQVTLSCKKKEGRNHRNIFCALTSLRASVKKVIQKPFVKLTFKDHFEIYYSWSLCNFKTLKKHCLFAYTIICFIFCIIIIVVIILSHQFLKETSHNDVKKLRNLNYQHFLVSQTKTEPQVSVGLLE